MPMPQDEYKEMHQLVAELSQAKQMGRPTAPISSKINALKLKYPEDTDLGRIDTYMKTVKRLPVATRRKIIDQIIEALKITKPAWIDNLEHTEIFANSQEVANRISAAIKERFKIDYMPAVDEYLTVADIADVLVGHGYEGE